MRILFLLSMAFLVGACKSSTVSISGKDEKAFVSLFLDAMVDSNESTKRPLHQYIDPVFLENKGLRDTDYLVDAYSLAGYRVESYKDGIVTVLIWGNQKNWMHRLQFKLTKEKSQLYLVPSLFEDEYVTPWWTVIRDVEG